MSGEEEAKNHRIYCPVRSLFLRSLPLRRKLSAPSAFLTSSVRY